MSSDTDSDERYVHTPNGDSSGGDASTTRSDSTTVEPDGFGRRGWVLVGALVLSVLVIPGVIYAYPYAAGSFGLTFFATYLLLPLVPAVLLGVLAVWSLSAAASE